MQRPVFLTVENVLLLQQESLEHEGGLAGVRDIGMLQAAVSMPQQRFNGELLHADLAAMAAAYLYHIAQNHPFHDGNKRAATLAAMTFLMKNGIALDDFPAPKAFEKVVMAVASSEMSKPHLIQWMRDWIPRKD